MAVSCIHTAQARATAAAAPVNAAAQRALFACRHWHPPAACSTVWETLGAGSYWHFACCSVCLFVVAGRIPGAHFDLPFVCPLDHLLDLENGMFR